MEESFIYFVENTLFISFLVGFIFLISAIITLIFPPKKINYLYGYRTPASMKNQEVWDFAQRYSGLKMVQAGVFLMLVSFVNVFLNPKDDFLPLVFGMAFIIAAVIFLFVSTEKAIRKNFPNN
jgi:uncharacterized membrane protein